MPKTSIVTRKFEAFTGKWGEDSIATGLKYVVFIDGVSYFEYHDGRLEKDEAYGVPLNPQWTIEVAELLVKMKQWKEVF